MVVIECPHCEEDIELDDGVFGIFECPECNEEFEYEDEEKLFSGTPTTTGDLNTIELEMTSFQRHQFYYGLGLSSFSFFPILISSEPGYIMPEISVFGAVFCVLWPLSGIITAISGFATGYRGLGIGGLAGLALSPFLLFFGCIIILGP